MRIYRHWLTRTVFINGRETHFTAGSNESPEKAQEIIDRKIEWYKCWTDKNEPEPTAEKIREMDAFFADGKTGMEYEASIREELCETLDEQNLVTRNRYGALVLNSESLAFLDIDELPLTAGERLFSLFGKRIEDSKTRILHMIEERSARSEFRETGFRVYETRKGIRLLLSLNLSPAHSFAAQKILYHFHVDPLYATLCAKQNCFRARLTPKPARIGMKTLLKFHFPYAEETRQERDKWLKEYEEKSSSYSVCRLLAKFGPDFTSPAVEYHDRICGVGCKRPLA